MIRVGRCVQNSPAQRLPGQGVGMSMGMGNMEHAWQDGVKLKTCEEEKTNKRTSEDAQTPAS